MSKNLKIFLIIVGAILLIGLLMVGKIIGGYNRVIAMDENIKGKWAQVER